MGKPFLTIDAQVRLLQSRGMATSPSTARILMREGYYSIVNGYKAPFIDVQATKAAGDDRYLSGATFESMYELFTFDRELRELTFHYLIRAEATVRTAISFCFSSAHQEPDAYLLQANFCSKDEYAKSGGSPDNYAAELSRLTAVLGSRANNSSAEFVVHYRKEHGGVPLWVLANDLTFGNLEHFYNLMRPVEQIAFCKMVAESTGRIGDKTLGYLDQKRARVCLEALVRFRNICAHDERIYCARVGGRKNIGYVDMLWMLERFLTPDEFGRLVPDLIGLLKTKSGNRHALTHILNSVGFNGLISELERRSRVAGKVRQPEAE